MYQQAIPYVLSMIVAAVISLAMVFYAWSRRPTPGAAPLALLMLSAAAFSLPYAMQVGSTDLQTALFWYKACFPGGVLVSPAWLVFALQYTGREKWLTRRNLALLAIVPVMSILLGWTNEFHGLYGSDFRLDTDGPFPVLSWTHGVGFWVHFVYAIVVALTGTALLIRSALRMSRLYRTQTIWLLIGALAPLTGNLIFVLGLSPIPQIDLSPFTFTITGLAWGWGLFRHRLLDIVPVARDAVIEDMSDGVIVLDTQNRIVDLNPAAQRIIGRPASEAVGQPVAQVLSGRPDGPTELAKVLLERYRDVTEAHAEITLGEDEVQRHFDLRISPLHDRHGRLTGRLVVLRDITERKRAEEALRQYAVELEARNEELGAFAHTVAHDLKGPLAPLLGYAEILEADCASLPGQKLQEYLRKISQFGHKMSRIIDELLLLAEVRKMEELTIEPLNMARIVAEARGSMIYLIEEHQAEIISPDAWPVALGYGPWVEAVWVNYLSNAIQYGGRPPRVELGATEQADGMVRFWVRDNGPGLTSEEQARLFTPFTQLVQVRARGHGLGLSIVRRIVEKLGGQVGIESELGRGSVFTFALPGMDS